jgi:hypothetical protein
MNLPGSKFRHNNPVGYDTCFKLGVEHAEKCKAEKVGWFTETETENDPLDFSSPVLDGMVMEQDHLVQSYGPFGSKEYGAASWGYQDGFQSIMDKERV